MNEKAVSEGFYHSPGWNKDYARIQILTVEDILNGKQPDLPPNLQTFKQGKRTFTDAEPQISLFGSDPEAVAEPNADE